MISQGFCFAGSFCFLPSPLPSCFCFSVFFFFFCLEMAVDPSSFLPGATLSLVTATGESVVGDVYTVDMASNLLILRGFPEGFTARATASSPPVLLFRPGRPAKQQHLHASHRVRLPRPQDHLHQERNGDPDQHPRDTCHGGALLRGHGGPSPERGKGAGEGREVG